VVSAAAAASIGGVGQGAGVGCRRHALPPPPAMRTEAAADRGAGDAATGGCGGRVVGAGGETGSAKGVGGVGSGNGKPPRLGATATRRRRLSRRHGRAACPRACLMGPQRPMISAWRRRGGALPVLWDVVAWRGRRRRLRVATSRQQRRAPYGAQNVAGAAAPLRPAVSVSG